VLTGGEPLLQLDKELSAALVEAGWRVAVETNGSVPFKEASIARDVSLLTVSPKRGLPIVLERATELKVVLPGGAAPWEDSELVEMDRTLAPAARFVQPQDPSRQVPETTFLPGKLTRFEASAQACIRFVKSHPGWRVSVQLHKILGLP
jgi:organic radical activating enzyme